MEVVLYIMHLRPQVMLDTHVGQARIGLGLGLGLGLGFGLGLGLGLGLGACAQACRGPAVLA